MIKQETAPAANRRYRRHLFDLQDLKRTAPMWAERLKPIERAWRTGQLDDANTAALYLLIGLEMRSPGRWLVGPSPLPDQQDPNLGVPLFEWFDYSGRLSQWLPRDARLSTIIHRHSLPGVRQSAREVLLKWLGHEWPMKLVDHVPSARMMLEEQVTGCRPVTAVFRAEELGDIVHDDRDALSFFLHDLGHASQFYSNPVWLKGQMKIYHLLKQAMDKGVLYEPARVNARWNERLDYLIADLNTHPAHFMSVFWATARECYREADQLSLFQSWRYDLYHLWQLDPALQSAVDRLAQGHEERAATLLFEHLAN